MADETIFVIDRIVARPGRGKALFDRYVQDYVPLATGRGLTLQHRLVSPPVWLEEQSNTLLFIWSVQGAGAYWGAEAIARYTPGTSDFWREIEPMVESRTRSVAAGADDMESLANV